MVSLMWQYDSFWQIICVSYILSNPEKRRQEASSERGEWARQRWRVSGKQQLTYSCYKWCREHGQGKAVESTGKSEQGCDLSLYQSDRWQWNLKELLQLQQSCWSACWFDHLFSAVINITQRMRCDKSRGQHLTCKIKQLRQGAWVQLVNNWRSGKALMLAPGRQK